MVAELRHLPVLDGWRALSIILVMIGHLLPVGPSSWGLNGAVAAAGMAMFFTLSGFLVTRFLLEDGNVQTFLVRRALRIVPAAWAGILLALIVAGGSFSEVVANLLFYANLPPFHLLPAAGHFWSLAVEVQFYVAIAAIVAVGGQNGLMALPLIAIAITGIRVTEGAHISIVTWLRADEILAGGIVALIHERRLGDRVRQWLSCPSILLIFPLLIASSHPSLGGLNYARPYISAILIGASLYNAPNWLRFLSENKIVVYIATASYALYIYHGILIHTWLGSGDTVAKYVKRPLLIIFTFAVAHISTFYYERRWIDLGRRLAPRQRHVSLRT